MPLFARWRSLAVPFLLLAALALRINDLNWDSGHIFHPDERHILMVTEAVKLPWPIDLELLLSPESPLNPRSFAYGSLIFYQLRFLQWLISTAAGLLGFGPSSAVWLEPGMGGLRYIGRALSALYDTGTVYLTYRLGLALYGRRVGLLAAAFLAFSVLPIQYAHFYASDTPLTFYVTLTLLLSAFFVRWGERRHALGAAVAGGLALACKIAAAPVLAAVAAAHALRYALPSDEDVAAGAARRISLPPTALTQAIGAFLGGLALTIPVFLVAEPYAIIDARTFLANTLEQNAMVNGLADVPYTRQYAGRPDYWYFVENVVLFAVGIPLGVAMFLGWLYVIVRAIRAPNRADLVLLAFVVPYFAITGGFHAKFIRYMLPMLPVLALFAAIGLFRIYDWARAQKRWSALEWREVVSPAGAWATRLAIGLIAFVTGTTALYALAYQNVYAGEHTAVEASRWIYANVPRGARLANEHWEEGIPVAVFTEGPNGERRQLDAGFMQYGEGGPLNLYENDDPRKLQELATTLARTDYILFFSNRLYATIPRLPQRYPMSTRYYELLFGEQLGFQLVAAFAKYPQLGPVALVDDTLSDPGLPVPALLREQKPAPITINLGRADEAFSVYDHPKVLVFKKVQPVTEAQVRAALQPALAQARPPGAAPIDRTAGTTFRSLLFTPEQALRNRLGGTYAELFDRHGLVNQIPFVVWSLALVAIGLAATPIAVLAFPRLADGGAPFARALGLLTMTWFTWILVSAFGLSASRVMTFVGFIGLLFVGAVCAPRALPRLSQIWAARRKTLLAAELAFWVPFVYFVWIRMLDPDLWHPARGGEKPMDLAYLMAAIKSTTYPPYDPWFAGGFLNYYYFGQIICANLIKLVGVVPTTAYNLVVPTLYAMTFAGAFSVAYNLARRNGLVPERVAIAGGAAAGLFVTTIGNLGGAGQLLEGLVRMAGTDYESLLPGAQYLVLGAMGLWNWAVGGQQFPIGTDWYWASTRVIDGTINEFPYFTFLYADLHAHMIGLPFTLLAMGLAVNLGLSRPARIAVAPFAARLGFADTLALPRRAPLSLPSLSEGTRSLIASTPEGALRVWLTGLVVGALLPINSWDFPTYLGLVAAAALIPWWLSARHDLSSLLVTIARVGTVVVLSYLLYFPFHQSFVSFYSGVRPAPPEHSPVPNYLLIHGFFLTVLISGVVLDLAAGMRRAGFPRTLAALARHWDRFPHLLDLRRRLVKQDDGSASLIFYGALAMLGVATVVAYLGFTLAGVLLALLLPVLWRLFSRPRTPESTFILLLFATGLALSIGVEFIAIDGDVGRMNTVFKFYLQIWAMWGVASAVALVMMRHHLEAIRRPGPGRWWAGLIVFLFACTLVYPVVATRARVADRFDEARLNPIPPTLDGTAYMRTATYREDSREAVRPAVLQLETDRKAIEWIWDNVPGSPVVAEARTPLYRWGSRISIYTGLPTIIGWDWHQTQQRFGFRDQVEERMQDLTRLYSDPRPEQALPLLSKYNVGLVYVGQLERAMYPEAGLRKFDEMVVRGELELVYDAEGVRIYRVPSEL